MDFCSNITHNSTTNNCFPTEEWISKILCACEMKRYSVRKRNIPLISMMMVNLTNITQTERNHTHKKKCILSGSICMKCQPNKTNL